MRGVFLPPTSTLECQLLHIRCKIQNNTLNHCHCERMRVDRNLTVSGHLQNFFIIGWRTCTYLFFSFCFLVGFFFPFQSSKEALSEVNATGVAMLFSAGTFLYVATVHVLPEVGGIAHSHKPESTGGKGLSRLEVAALVLGCLIPLVLSIGHHH